MNKILGRRTRIAVLATAIIVIALVPMMLMHVLAPPPPPPGQPEKLNEYGVVRVYASVVFTGTSKITISSTGFEPFFVSRLTLFLNRAADYDIVLDTVNIDGTGDIQVSGYSAVTTKVVVVPAGLTFGDAVGAFPSALSMFLVKDPMGNDAIVATGGGGNGVVIGVRFLTGGVSTGTTLSAIGTVVAPSNETVSMTMT